MVSLKLVILLILASSAWLSVVYAQEDELDGAGISAPVVPLSKDSLHFLGEPQPLPDWYDCVGNLPRNVASFAVLSVKERTLPTIIGLSALTLGLVASDHQTYTFTSGFYERSQTVASVSDFFVSLGDGKSQLILAGVFGAFGLVASDHRAIRTASQTLEVLLATGLVVQTLKHISGRESPSVTSSETGTWRPFPSLKKYQNHQSKYHAFPSGHIATSMATVTVLAENYPEQGWLKPVGYSIVGLVGIGLVQNGWHWYSDLPLGIALGYAFGKIVARPDGETVLSNPDEVKLSLVPVMDEYGNGVRVSLRF